LQDILSVYAEFRRTGNSTEAEKRRCIVQQHPFSGVLVLLLRIAAGRRTAGMVRPECLAALQAYPEIRSWV
jgi:hypothetical protein